MGMSYVTSCVRSGTTHFPVCVIIMRDIPRLTWLTPLDEYNFVLLFVWTNFWNYFDNWKLEWIYTSTPNGITLELHVSLHQTWTRTRKDLYTCPRCCMLMSHNCNYFMQHWVNYLLSCERWVKRIHICKVYSLTEEVKQLKGK
jgi:hypothetical protein